MRKFNNVLCFIAIFFLNGIKIIPKKNLKEFRLIIDIGHGGKDPGTICNKCCEKDIARKIAHKLIQKIKKNLPNVKIICTRPSDKILHKKKILSLKERIKIANINKGDFFISFHVNAHPKRENIKGFEIYIRGDKVYYEKQKKHADLKSKTLEVVERENRVILMEENYEKNYEKYFDNNSIYSKILAKNYERSHFHNSLLLAEQIHSKIEKLKEIKSRGIKKAGFMLLWAISLPSLLIELGYLTNKNEALFLSSDEGQRKIAEAIFQAFKEYKNILEKNV